MTVPARPGLMYSPCNPVCPSCYDLVCGDRLRCGNRIDALYVWITLVKNYSPEQYQCNDADGCDPIGEYEYEPSTPPYCAALNGIYVAEYEACNEGFPEADETTISLASSPVTPPANTCFVGGGDIWVTVTVSVKSTGRSIRVGLMGGDPEFQPVELAYWLFNEAATDPWGCRTLDQTLTLQDWAVTCCDGYLAACRVLASLG